MEKIFHTGQLPKIENTLKGQVQLRRQHLILEASVAQNAFGDERQVYAVYYDNLGMLILAPMSDDMFKQAHECALLMLKDKNLKGDKSISLQEIIIDNELDDTDRELVFMGAPGLKMLQVKLK